MKKNNIITIIIVSILLSFFCGFIGSYIVINNTTIGQNVIKNITKSNYTDNSIADAVDKIYDATVVVEGYKENTLVSTGTGFAYKKENDTAFIMTNNHVVNDCDSVKLILSDNSEIDASIKGKETYSDIAVLTTDASKIKKIATLGSTEKIASGDTVFTIGSPQGAEFFGTVTKGVLSSKDRLVAVSYSNQVSDYYMKVLQTDAAINPGNSGGPICNINGEVIGITNMKLVDNSVEGMGFAIPIEDAIYYANILEENGKLSRPYVGISMIDITDEYTLYQYNVQIPTNVTNGIVVLEVQDPSPAKTSGLKKGDIITSIAGNNITSVADFRYELYKHQIGEEIEIKFIRNNKEKKTTIKLEENKDS